MIGFRLFCQHHPDITQMIFYKIIKYEFLHTLSILQLFHGPYSAFFMADQLQLIILVNKSSEVSRHILPVTDLRIRAQEFVNSFFQLIAGGIINKSDKIWR